MDISAPFSQLIPHLRGCERARPASFDSDDALYYVYVKSVESAEFPQEVKIEFSDESLAQ